MVAAAVVVVVPVAVAVGAIVIGCIVVIVVVLFAGISCADIRIISTSELVRIESKK